jgi:hypothetical protein
VNKIIKKNDSVLYIHAVNVHQGGGARLLRDLLNVIDPHSLTVLNVDRRMKLTETLSCNLKVNKINNSIFARLYAEIFLWRTVKKK